MRLALLLLAACAGPAEVAAGDAAEVASGDGADAEAVPAKVEPPPPIADLLLTAAEKGGVGDREAAIAAWRESYAGFERVVEPGLRQRCDACATEIEYRFGLVRAEIAKPGGKPLALVDDLRKRLEPYLPPPAPEPATTE